MSLVTRIDPVARACSHTSASAAEPSRSPVDVVGLEAVLAKEADQIGRQLRIDEEAHRLRRADDAMVDRLGGVGESGADVLVAEIVEVR